MERFISGLLNDFEGGKIDRRTFCERVALAAVVFAAGEGAANAAPASGFKMLGVNHMGYTCPDYRVARDFYASVFGMEVLPSPEGSDDARVAFGPPQGEGGTFLVMRNGDIATDAKSVVDHVCYTISDWDEGKVNAALSARGFMPTGRPGSLHIYDPFDFDVQFANSTEENGFR